MTARRTLTIVLVAAIAAVAAAPAAADPPQSPAPGSLVRTTMKSEVGVVLDEIPGSMRDRVAAAMLAKPASFWKQRAQSQVRLTLYRLIFRDFFYPKNKLPLALAPEPVWSFELLGQPRRHTLNGHDLVGVDYKYSSVLLSNEASPGEAEPRLAKVGGQWHEPYILPVDPELLLQRTGYACMDEEQFPFNSVDSEEVDTFYDQTTVVQDTLASAGFYHFTLQPNEPCVQSLQSHVGKVVTSLLFERLPWDPDVADQYRYGKVTGNDPDLEIFLPDFLGSRTTYRYIHDDATAGCELAEGSVGGSGWRRLLQFSTSDENVGERALTIGGVDYAITGNPQELDSHNLFVFSPCHRHFHFKYYGTLGWSGGAIANSKQGFCLQSTARVANRETSPLHNPYSNCAFQGVEAGWADQYKAGLPNQWIDSTDLPAGTGARTFLSNPNGFLCEGTFLDENGQPLAPGEPVVWSPTGLIADNGQPVEAPKCQLGPTWADNNEHSVPETIEPHGLGLINTPCTRGQIGPLRNCGFSNEPTTASCVPGEDTTATFSIPHDAKPQVVRLTEFSHQLDAPIPARYEDSYVPLTPGVSDQPAMLRNFVVRPNRSSRVEFTCPAPRTGGAPEPGGTYSIYTAPVFPDDPPAPVAVL